MSQAPVQSGLVRVTVASGTRRVDLVLPGAVPVAELVPELAPLRSDWTGSAQQAYQSAKAKWDAAMLEMKALLAETGTTVSQSNQEYMAADQRGAASFDI